jgi:hypothetical protein
MGNVFLVFIDGSISQLQMKREGSLAVLSYESNVRYSFEATDMFAK